MKVKIRGIYTTAITQILNEKGIEVVQPSKLITERFNIDNKGSATTIIYDKEDLNGLAISGTNASEITSIITEKLSDSAVRKMELGEIYCGKIKTIESKFNNIFVDLGNNEEGLLTLQNYWGFLREGEKVLVQVKGKIRGKKILSTKLRIFGENAILIKDGFAKVSKHIRTEGEQDRLAKISEEFKNDGWGILWKAFAEGKTDDELRTEIKHLYEQEKEIKEQFNQLSEPGVIQNGVDIYIVEFGALSKKELDSVRKKVISTIPGHHFLKSGNQSIVVDFAEALENIDYNLISDKLNKVLMKNGPSPGRFYEIFQKKLSGKEIVFRGIIESVNGEEITIKRKMYAGGKLDGLGGEIKFGDYALTKFKPNSWIVEHNYFDKNGYSKGTYFNINTPVETYPNFARYIDLEIDVIEKAGKKEIIDTEKLERVTNEKMIKGELAQRAVEIANQIVKGEQK